MVVVVPVMLNHLAASFLAFAAFCGAALHVLVVGELFAFLAASGAGLGAGLADHHCERAAASDDLGGCGAEVGAVAASHQRREVVLLPLHQLVGAVRRAGIAFVLAR